MEWGESIIQCDWCLFISGGKMDFPGSPVVKNMPANVEDTGSIPGLGRSHMTWSS